MISTYFYYDYCIWVGLPRTGNIAWFVTLEKNFAGPLWPHLIFYTSFLSFCGEHDLLITLLQPQPPWIDNNALQCIKKLLKYTALYGESISGLNFFGANFSGRTLLSQIFRADFVYDFFCPDLFVGSCWMNPPHHPENWHSLVITQLLLEVRLRMYWLTDWS